MRAAGIICEFDPFHNGHKYLVDAVRKDLCPDAVVCVMSGAFTQRGQPAAWDKFARARAAVMGGADLVLELPALYAVNSAEYFARGGVRVLKGLGCVEHLAFGSESGSGESLMKAAALTVSESPQFSDAVKAAIDEGLSYPAAYQKAVSSLFPQVDARLFRDPNDTLGISYIRQIIKQDAGMGVHVVKRIGAAHGSEEASSEAVSGSYVRNILSTPDAVFEDASVHAMIPESTAKVLFSEDTLGHPSGELMFAMISARILAASTEELSELPEVSEGLENRIKDAVLKATDMESLINGIVTRRYTKARVCRVLTQLLLGIDKETLSLAEKNSAAYAKVLAFNGKGAKLLRYAQEKGHVPVLSNINKNLMIDEAAGRMLAIDIRSNDIYTILCGRPPAEFSDKVRVPIIMEN